jgi:hypothetical protein
MPARHASSTRQRAPVDYQQTVSAYLLQLKYRQVPRGFHNALTPSFHRHSHARAYVPHRLCWCQPVHPCVYVQVIAPELATTQME